MKDTTLLHMHTRTCVCGGLVGLCAPPPPPGGALGASVRADQGLEPTHGCSHIHIHLHSHLPYFVRFALWSGPVSVFGLRRLFVARAMPAAAQYATPNILLQPFGGAPRPLVPYQCMLHQLNAPDDEVVHVTLTDAGGALTIACAAAAAPGAVPLAHSPICPIRAATRTPGGDPAPAARRPLRVGVVVLVESTEPGGAPPKVLLTRRHQAAKLFPGVWVLPGGHVDEGEDLLTAALREVLEETGIRIAPAPGARAADSAPGQGAPATGSAPAPGARASSDSSCPEPGSAAPAQDLLCLWESSYPPSVEEGPPIAQHLVCTYRVKLPCPAGAVPLRLQRSEVSGAAWVGVGAVRAWLRGHPGTRPPCPVSVDGTWPPAVGEVAPTAFAGVRFATGAGEELRVCEYQTKDERIALGHQFALVLWHSRACHVCGQPL